MFKSNVASFDVNRSLVCSLAKSISGVLLGNATCWVSTIGLYGIVCPMNSEDAGSKIVSAAFRISWKCGILMPWNREIC